MGGLQDLLERNTTDSVWKQLEEVAPKLNPSQKLLVLKAEQMSGISENDLKRLQEFPFVEMVFLKDCSHFIHINRVDDMRKTLLKTLEL